MNFRVGTYLNIMGVHKYYKKMSIKQFRRDIGEIKRELGHSIKYYI